MASAPPTAYPLQWPAGWPRTVYRQSWPATPKPNVTGALKELQDEMRRLGAKNIVLSSNCTLGKESPLDTGVVAYAVYDGQQIAIPCDRWDTVAGNLRAIAKTIEAMRGMERWGAKHMIRAMFQGFTAIAGPAPKNWRDVMGFHPDSRPTRDEVVFAYRERARKAHPDAGGSDAAMAELNAARDAALAEIA